MWEMKMKKTWTRLLAVLLMAVIFFSGSLAVSAKTLSEAEAPYIETVATVDEAKETEDAAKETSQAAGVTKRETAPEVMEPEKVPEVTEPEKASEATEPENVPVVTEVPEMPEAAEITVLPQDPASGRRQLGSGSLVYVNPLYRDVVTEADILSYGGSVEAASLQGSASLQAASEDYVTTEEAGGAIIRAALLERAESVTVEIHVEGGTATSDEGKACLIRMFEAAFVHTGAPEEGDSLRFNYGGFRAPFSFGMVGSAVYYRITFQDIAYYTTAAQEQTLRTVRTDLLETLKVSEAATDYDKARLVYDYICENIHYDQDHLTDTDYKLKYTAYAALINRTAVCQGYAVLLYQLLLQAGVDCRVITGVAGSNNENHAWNIVKLGSIYYLADSTWDSSYSVYRWFLNGSANFTQHATGSAYTTEAFTAAYPISGTDYTDPRGQLLRDIYLACFEESADEESLGLLRDRLDAGETVSEIISSLMFGESVTSQNLCNSCFVQRLHQAVLGRAAGEEGTAYLVSLISETGMKREEIFNTLVGTEEFVNRCEAVGAAPGSAMTVPEKGTIPTGNCARCGAEDGISVFVRNFYLHILDRDPDQEGFESWRNGLYERENVTGYYIGYNFVFSEEFVAKNLCNRHFVEHLYRAILGREADEDGLEGWIGGLQGGMTREEVFNLFMSSQEYQTLCRRAGIRDGHEQMIDNPAPGEGTYAAGSCTEPGCSEECDAAKFARRLYTTCLGRGEDAVDDSEVDYWRNQLCQRFQTGSEVAYNFFFSPEFKLYRTNGSVDNAEYVRRLYISLMDRAPAADDEGFSGWVAGLDAGMSDEDVFAGFIGSDEFLFVCNRYGIKCR